MVKLRTLVSMWMIELLVALVSPVVHSFITNHCNNKHHGIKIYNCQEQQSSSSSLFSTKTGTAAIRRDECLFRIMNSMLLIPGSVVATTSGQPSVAAAADDNKLVVVKNPSGLKYVDLKAGTGLSPRYGQLCSIQYSAYLKLPKKNPEKFDSDVYLIKHGNGKTIPGLDEGLHTLRVGGKRQLIIPPKLGYIDIGLGPLPEYPWNRWKLNNLLDQMVEMRGGDLIFEVELLTVIDDEADQGYYEDSEPTAAEMEFIETRLRKKQAPPVV